ncbi:MAG: LamG domain-containing protein [Anaerolineae bacterium]|nr:LamG domain-containing protein [Anaerolineae bacterium]
MQVTEILQAIKPYVLGWIETGGEEGGYAPSPHELDGAHHIGTLTTSQYPDALLRDGSRSLTGNLSVEAGITIDGVDLSAFKTAYDSHVLNANAHHNQVSLDANADTILSLSVQQLGLDTQLANRVFAGPTSGGAAIPTFRALVIADIPALGGTPTLTFTTSNAAGSASTYVRTDASLAIFDATAPTTIQPDDVATVGSATFAARRDHKHAIVTAAPGNQAIGDSATKGTATSFARSDHKHGMPSFATPSVALGTAAAAGSAATLLRSDCTIVVFDVMVPTTIQPDDTAATGSAAVAARRDHKHAIVAAAPAANSVSLAVSAEGTATSFARSDHSHSLSQAIVPTWTGLHTFNAGIDLAGTLEFQGAQSITSTFGDLTIAPAGDIKLNPTGAQIRVMASHTLQSDNYASQTTGWGISYAGGADFRYLFADELHVKSFIADLEQALAGGQIISKSVAMLSRDFTAPAAGGTTTLYVWDLPSAENMAVFESGDIVRLRMFSRAGGSLTVADCWGVVTSYSNLSGKEQSWTFTRSSGGNAGSMSASTVVAADALVLDYGTTGNGFYEVNAVDGAYAENSPYSQIVTWATHPATGQTVRVRLGNLYGITSTTEYGLYAGEGVSAGDSYLRLTDQNFELHNLDLAMYDDGNVQRIGMDAGAGSSEALMWAGESESDPGFVVYGDGTVWLSTLAISGQMGDMLFTQADGLALWGPGCAITPTSWTSTRGQTATISGAFHEVAGPWAGSRALVVEGATTNVIPDPIFGYGDLSGWSVYIGGATRDTSVCLFGNASARVVSAGGNGGLYKHYTTSSGGSWTASAYVYVESYTSGYIYVQMRIHYTDGTTTIVNTAADVTKICQWQRLVATATADGGKTVDYVQTYVYSAAVPTLTFYFDGVQVENKAYATSLCWGGAGTGYVWNGDGTPHANTSTRTSTTVTFNPQGVIDLSSGSISIWFQMPYDAGSGSYTNTPGIFQWWDTWNTNSFYIWLSNTLSSIGVTSYTGGVSQLPGVSVALTGSKAGDWHNVIATFETNSVKLYLDGTLAGTDTSFTPPTISSTTAYIGYVTDRFSGAISEVASFGCVLTAEEVASIYARGKPLVDAGATKNPGIYILDGSVSIATSNGGPRVQLDGDGLSAFSDSTTQTVAIETDGDVFIGSDVGATATTSFAFFATAQTYGTASESMGAGDLLLGDNSAGKFNLKWDVSEGNLLLRRGTANRIVLDAGADTIDIGDPAAYHIHITSSSLSIMKSATVMGVSITPSYIRVGDTLAATDYTSVGTGYFSITSSSVLRFSINSGVMTINDSGGSAVFTFDASASAEITKKLKMPGANSAIAIGTTPPTSSSAGTGIWIDRTGIYGLLSGTYQVKIDATTGALIGGAGGVAMDVNGYNVYSDTGYTAGKAINFYDGVTRVGEIYLRALGSPLYTNWMEIQTEMIAAKNSQIRIKSQAPTSYTGQVSLEVDINGGAGIQPYLRLSNYGSTYESLATNCVISIVNSTAAPSSSVTNGVLLYAQDVSASSELRVRDEAGNVTTLSPHNFDLIPEGPSESMAWAYYGERDGIAINVDMLKLARLMEKLTGEKLVYISESLN